MLGGENKEHKDHKKTEAELQIGQMGPTDIAQ